MAALAESPAARQIQSQIVTATDSDTDTATATSIDTDEFSPGKRNEMSVNCLCVN